LYFNESEKYEKNKIIICLLLIFVIFIALIIKINYFFIIITGLLIFFFLALDMNNKKLKFDLEIYFFEVITTFYLSREKGMGFNLLEDYYDDIDKLKLLVIFFIIFGIFYILIKKKNYLLKLYFIAIFPISLQEIFYIKYISEKLEFFEIVDMIISSLLIDCWLVGILIFIISNNNPKWTKTYILLVFFLVIKFKVMHI
jgi:hypothetical protein